ncbi:MAG TPA: PKD domain-containing protein [Bacteroidales bacterium]
MKTILTFFLICLLLSNIYAQKPVADFEFVVKNYDCYSANIWVINKTSNADSCFWNLHQNGSYTYSDKNEIDLWNWSIERDSKKLKVSLIAKKEKDTDTITKTFDFNTLLPNFKYEKIDTLINDTILYKFESYIPFENSKSLSCKWDFGDGTYSTEKNVQHKFQNYGTKLVTFSLNYVDFTCDYSYQKYIHFTKDSTHAYIPFPTKNAMWTEMYFNPYPVLTSVFHSYALKGENNDTIINDKIYHKLYHSYDTTFTEDEVCGGLREENRIIYYYSIRPIDNILCSVPENTEVKLFNSNYQLGDTLRTNEQYWVSEIIGYLPISKYNDIMLCDNIKRTYYQTELPYSEWIEGIGNLRGLLFKSDGIPNDGRWNDLICFYQDRKLVYHNDFYKQCFYFPTDKLGNSAIQQSVSIQPNPLTDNGLIIFPSIFENLDIIDVNGIVRKKFSVSGKTSINISHAELPPGFYIVRLAGKTAKTISAKLLVQ